jgi:hypothetical protein
MFTDTIEMKVGKKEFTEERNIFCFDTTSFMTGNYTSKINSIIEVIFFVFLLNWLF